MVRVAILLVLIGWGSFQDETDISRWIADLGHEEIARREEAHGHLLKAGVKALAALKGALDSKDVEKVTRVRRIIDEIERPERERKHDLEQRRLRLPTFSVDFKETPATEVFRKMGELLGREFKSEADPEARVTYVAAQAPIQQILDSLEDRLDVSIRDKSTHWEVSRLALPRKPRAYAPGVTFEFNKRLFKAEGKAIGTRIQVSAVGEASSAIEAWDVVGPDGRPRTIRQCESCGSRLALVEGEPAEFRIRLKGRVIWMSQRELKIDDPGVEQSFSVGPFTIAYSFPGVVVATRDALHPRLFPHARVEGRLKEGVTDDGTIGIGGVFGRRFQRKDPAKWCDCGPGAKPAIDKTPVEPITSEDFRMATSNPVTDFASVTIQFTRYFEEPFEAEAVVPAD